MNRRLPPPTQAQQARMDMIQRHGCIIAKLAGLGWIEGEIHHLTDRGHTISQDATICINTWSHRGVVLPGWTQAQCEDLLGPPLIGGNREFTRRYGDWRALLEYQNNLIGLVAAPVRFRRHRSTKRPGKVLAHSGELA